jgi:hypothetical protein
VKGLGGRIIRIITVVVCMCGGGDERRAGVCEGEREG